MFGGHRSDIRVFIGQVDKSRRFGLLLILPHTHTQPHTPMFKHSKVKKGEMWLVSSFSPNQSMAVWVSPKPAPMTSAVQHAECRCYPKYLQPHLFCERSHTWRTWKRGGRKRDFLKSEPRKEKCVGEREGIAFRGAWITLCLMLPVQCGAHVSWCFPAVLHH